MGNRRFGLSRAVAAGAATALLLSACQKPQSPLQLGVHEFNADIDLEQQAQLQQRAAQPNPGIVGLTGPAVYSQAASSAKKAPSAKSSPAARPSAGAAAARTASPRGSSVSELLNEQDNPLLEDPTFAGLNCKAATSGVIDPTKNRFATNTKNPPTPATYEYRNKGTASVAGKGGEVPLLSRRTINNVVGIPSNNPSAGPPAFTFDITTEHGGTSSTTSYLVVPLSFAEQTAAGQPQTQPHFTGRPGIYITSISDASGRISPVTQPPPAQPGVPADPSGTGDKQLAMKIMQFPTRLGDRPAWHVEAFDASTVTTVTFDGKVVGTDAVNACGEVMQAWRVDITNGKITSPLGRDVSFATTYKFGTQYGGFSLQDYSVSQGKTPTGDVRSEVLSIINTVPEFPG